MEETSPQLPAAAAGTIDVGGDLTVNRLGFGAMRITGRGVWGDPPDREEAKAVLRRVVELGVNFIDTADSYGPGVSEELIAEALAPYPDDLVIATKGGLERSGPGQWPVNGHPDHLREACDGSLRRLGLEQIPLYQLHRPDPKVPLDDSLGDLPHGALAAEVLDRGPRQERDLLLLAQVDQALGRPVGDVEAVLDRHDRGQLLRLSQLTLVDVGQPDVPDLALLLELDEGADRVVERDLGVGAV